MADVPRVTFENVWKKFRRGVTHDSLRDLIPSLVQGVVLRRSDSDLGAKDFWALRDVSFEVQAGKALGIIGRNGAGKSTILKILTRVLAPTRGTYHTIGRVGALIEVAAGFHPDLTGRENIFLQAAVLGMPRGMVDRVFDSIVDFAGVEAFIDTPVKRYSSGMNARLGFAIAAHLEPDVLIIDEVLSVGDTAFQAKCLERMRSFKREGVAIVFVSHNMHAISELCDDALQLSGAVVRRGLAGEVVRQYLSSGSKKETVTDGAVHLAALGFSCTDGSPAAFIAPGAELRHGLRITAVQDIADCSIMFVVRRSTDNVQVFERWYRFSDLGFDRIEAGQCREIEARFTAHLLRGLYEVHWNVHHHPTTLSVGFLAPAALFQVDEDDSQGGIADLELRLTGAT